MQNFMQPPTLLLVAPILLLIFCFVFLGKGKKLKMAKSAYKISGQNLEFQDMNKISGHFRTNNYFQEFQDKWDPCNLVQDVIYGKPPILDQEVFRKQPIGVKMLHKRTNQDQDAFSFRTASFHK